MAPSTGFKEKTVNSGKIRNTGIEIDLNVRPIMTHSFVWDMNANWYTNKNEVRDLGPVKEQFASTLGSAYGLNVQPFIQRVGCPIGAIYGWQKTSYTIGASSRYVKIQRYQWRRCS